jgi:hypothetical protein
MTQGCNIIVISWLYRTCWNNLATSLIVSTRLLQVVNSLFQTSWRLVGRLATRCEIFTRVHTYTCVFTYVHKLASFWVHWSYHVGKSPDQRSQEISRLRSWKPLFRSMLTLSEVTERWWLISIELYLFTHIYNLNAWLLLFHFLLTLKAIFHCGRFAARVERPILITWKISRAGTSRKLNVVRDAGTGGGQEGQPPPLPFTRRGKGGKGALSI